MPDQNLSEEIFRLVVESSDDAIITKTIDGTITGWNPAAERLFGFTAPEAIGKSIDIIVPDELRNEVRGILGRIGKGEKVDHHETVRSAKDGHRIDVSLSVSPIKARGGKIIGAAKVARDITERKLAQAALQQFAERERFYIAAVESSVDVIVTETLDGIVTGWNPAAERLFGFTAQEVIGKNICIIVPDELHGEVQDNLDRTRNGGKIDHYETVRIAKNGDRIDVSLSISPVKAPDGRTIGVTMMARDITAKKKNQKMLAVRSEELQRSNEDLAQFAYVASHDLQEPLRMVVSYTELLAEHLAGGLDAKAEKYIKYALAGAKRMQQLIKDLLAFSRVGTQGQKPVEIDSGIVLKNVLDSLKVAIDENHAEIVCDKLPAVPADAGQLAQVFQNLIGNALKFHGDRAPRIHIGAKRSNGSWQFHVEDNGIGIDKQYGELVFQMFQRLHERGRYDGSGIGLSIAKKIVERHGGRIWFKSEADKGSTFYFTMPVTNGNAA